MDNSDFIGHLASTASALDASHHLVEKLLRDYFADLHALAEKRPTHGLSDAQELERIFTENIGSRGVASLNIGSRQLNHPIPS